MVASMAMVRGSGSVLSHAFSSRRVDPILPSWYAVSHDNHLFVNYNPFTSSEHSSPSSGPHEPSPAEQGQFRTMLEQQNCTFSKLEILNQNIGYIKFGAFPPPD